jgi:hypothetical protein
MNKFKRLTVYSVFNGLKLLQNILYKKEITLKYLHVDYFV